MLLKDRIKEIMDNEQLTASLFADSIGVQRSSISHILSGRNKPSLEFLQKVLTSYPKYSIEWLIMGKGNPTIAENSSQSTVHKQTRMPELFDDLITPEPQLTESNTTESIPKSINKEAIKKEVTEEKEDFNNIEEHTTETIKDSEKTLTTPKQTEKEIEQIIVCYTDKTFMAYKPN